MWYICSIAVSLRLKSVKNIQKITKSMKMIAAVKYARAERELRPARSFGEGAQGSWPNPIPVLLLILSFEILRRIAQILTYM